MRRSLESSGISRGSDKVVALEHHSGLAGLEKRKTGGFGKIFKQGLKEIGKGAAQEVGSQAVKKILNTDDDSIEGGTTPLDAGMRRVRHTF